MQKKNHIKTNYATLPSPHNIKIFMNTTEREIEKQQHLSEDKTIYACIQPSSFHASGFNKTLPNCLPGLLINKMLGCN